MIPTTLWPGNKPVHHCPLLPAERWVPPPVPSLCPFHSRTRHAIARSQTFFFPSLRLCICLCPLTAAACCLFVTHWSIPRVFAFDNPPPLPTTVPPWERTAQMIRTTSGSRLLLRPWRRGGGSAGPTDPGSEKTEKPRAAAPPGSGTDRGHLRARWDGTEGALDDKI